MERPRSGLAVTAVLPALALLSWSCVGEDAGPEEREESSAVEEEPAGDDGEPPETTDEAASGEGGDPAATDDGAADDAATDDGAADDAATDDGAADDGADRPEVDQRLRALIDVAVADLSERLDVEARDITVVSAETVVWSDPSLGCPEPGMRYRQLPQDGAKVVLDHDGRSYDYHAGGDRPEPFLCEPAPRDPDAPRDLEPDLPRDLEPDVPPPGGDLDI